MLLVRVMGDASLVPSEGVSSRSDAKSWLVLVFCQERGVHSPELALRLRGGQPEVGRGGCIRLKDFQKPRCKCERCSSASAAARLCLQCDLEVWIDVPIWGLEIDNLMHVIVHKLLQR